MIVVKVGTNVLSNGDGAIDTITTGGLVQQISGLKSQGEQVILISSGAVGSGKQVISPTSDALTSVEKRQLWAAVGQPRLLNYYMQQFSKYDIHVAQILATKEDFRDRKHYLHMRNCFKALLNENVIPIVNENDVIAVDELMFTDNDELASLVASMMGARALYILTNVDGVFKGDPSEKGAELIREINADSQSEIEFKADLKSSFGRGGMATKYRMSKRLASMGIDVFIANGKRPGILEEIHQGTGIFTRFVRHQNVSSVKKWIAHQDKSVVATVVINDGAKEVLLREDRAASLLPIGILKVEGNFSKGDLINIMDQEKNIIALGRVQYGVESLQKYIGLPGQKALVHYDYLVLNRI
ncbi:UNVERIFIED_CONTAM: hypothetical protein GTU68_028314 [Idotea baltica]|nr:hypothetical protein [Idotea baltica]